MMKITLSRTPLVLSSTYYHQGDDPLLAVACQNLLIIIDGEISNGKDFATLELIVTELDKSGISFEEIDEAIEHLLMTGAIIEVEDDCFITI